MRKVPGRMAFEVHFTMCSAHISALWDSCPELFACCPDTSCIPTPGQHFHCTALPEAAEMSPASICVQGQGAAVLRCQAAGRPPPTGRMQRAAWRAVPSCCPSLFSHTGATELQPRYHEWLWEPQSAGTAGKREQCETGELSMRVSVLVARCFHHFIQKISHIM